jgi:hypothetical protein
VQGRAMREELTSLDKKSEEAESAEVAHKNKTSFCTSRLKKLMTGPLI